MLPVSILIPTRNSREHLPGHVDCINALSHLVEEIVIVDSESCDGTREYLKANLRHDRIRMFSHPPGLYQSWNFGIQKLQGEFTYIAAVGDGLEGSSLEALVNAARTLQADMVVSPPTFFTPDGRTVDIEWPVHDLVKRGELSNPSLIPNPVWYIWNALWMPYSLIGSSASNLYRTELLRRAPFPCDYGSLGDTAWAVQRGTHLKTALAPRVRSKFLLHEASASSQDQGDLILQKLHELSAAALDEAPWLDQTPEETRERVFRAREFSQVMAKRLAIKNDYIQLRRRPLKGFKPRYWRLKSQKARYKRRAAEIGKNFLDQVSLPWGKK